MDSLSKNVTQVPVEITEWSEGELRAYFEKLVFADDLFELMGLLAKSADGKGHSIQGLINDQDFLKLNPELSTWLLEKLVAILCPNSTSQWNISSEQDATCYLTRPKVHVCFVGSYIALRLSDNLKTHEMPEGYKSESLADPHYSIWRFAQRTTDGPLNWIDLSDKQHIAVDEEGTITTNGFKFPRSHWAWPEVAWSLTPTMIGFGLLEQLLRDGPANPLCALCDSEQASVRCLSIQTRDKLIEALNLLQSGLSQQ